MASTAGNLKGKEPETTMDDDEENEEEDILEQPDPKQRAERAAAAAAARARGEIPLPAVPGGSALSSVNSATNTTNLVQPIENGSSAAAGPSTSGVSAFQELPVDNLSAISTAPAASIISVNPNASATPNALVNSLSEQLECSICREIVYQPVSVLDCLHTFCGSCLIQWVSTHPGEPECPTCRSAVRATKDSHQHNSLRDVLITMDHTLDRSDEEKAEMRRIYTPGSTIDLVQTRALVRGQDQREGQVQGQGGEGQQAQQQQIQTQNQMDRYYAPPMRVMMNPIDELNLLLRFYFPCPTCETGNPHRYLCEHPIPDPRIILALGRGTDRPIPRSSTLPQGHTQCFNCKRPNLIPLRDRRQYPQDVCSICSERFCQNLLGYCGPIKQPKARGFAKLDEYVMPPRQGLISSTFSNLFGTGNDPDSIGTFMPHLFGNDPERVRSFDVWLQKHKQMNLNDFYHAVVGHAISASPQPLVVGGDEQGIARARWQGVPGRYMRNRIRRDDWTCISCAKDLIEAKAREWYNQELARDTPPPNSPLFSSQANLDKRNQQRKEELQLQQQAQAAAKGGFFTSIKKGFNDLGDKFNDLTTDPVILPPLPPTLLLPAPLAANFTDRQVLQGNQLTRFPTELATSRDSDGHPVFLCIFHHSSGAMLPGKICPNLRNPVRAAWEGKEYMLTKEDKYETFLENPDVYKWIRISNSIMPSTEIPVTAGIERDGRTPLYIACAWHEGLRIPGYSGPNTMGARIAFGGSEITVKEDYEVLVWRRPE